MVKKHKKLLIFLIIIALIVGGIVAFIALNSTPDRLTQEERDQAVADILGRKPNLEGPDIKTGNTAYDGDAIYFEYPAKAVIYDYIDEGSRNNDSTIESFSFDMENPRLVLNYKATNKPSLGDVYDEPAVKLRDDKSRGYEKEDSYMIDGVEAAVFKLAGGGSVKAEKTAFVLNNGTLYTLSITGSSIEDVEELFESITKSAYFK